MIKSISTRLAAWNRRRDAMRELSMLNSRELAELGIGSGDIRAAADGSLLATDEPFVPAAADDASIGPDWARHAPTSLAA